MKLLALRTEFVRRAATCTGLYGMRSSANWRRTLQRRARVANDAFLIQARVECESEHRVARDWDLEVFATAGPPSDCAGEDRRRRDHVVFDRHGVFLRLSALALEYALPPSPRTL